VENGRKSNHPRTLRVPNDLPNAPGDAISGAVAAPSPTIVDGPLIQKIFFVSRFRRPKGFAFEGDGCPGHKINFICRGRAREECGGRSYELGAGTAIWYHETERIRGRVIKAPWAFYSVNFIAPSLPPPNHENRLFRLPGRGILDQCEDLLKSWQDTSVPSLVRFFRVKARLSQAIRGDAHG